MSNLHRFYPESRFGGFSDIDGTVLFFTRVNALLNPAHVVLDVGCGRGAYVEDPVEPRRNLRILKGKARKVIGIDVDRAAESNPCIDEFGFIDEDHWPVDDRSIDLLITDNTLEHIEDPDRFFSEIDRVLKAGGYLCIRTPNSWSYIALAARLIPGRFHTRVIRGVQDGRKEEDIFPTYYRCNSIRTMRAKMRRLCGDDCTVYGYESEPHYLSFSAIAYRLGRVHQRLAPQWFRPALFAFGRKKDDSAEC